jgi:hypothetical protein
MIKADESHLPSEIQEYNKQNDIRATHDAAVQHILSRIGPRLGYSLSTSPFIRSIIGNAIKALPNGTDEEIYRMVQNAVPFAYRSN